MVTYEELKKLSPKELEEEMTKSGLELAKLRLLVTTRQSKESAKLKGLRKYLARIKTLKRALQLETVSKQPKKVAA